jgi:hypothetical protein
VPITAQQTTDTNIAIDSRDDVLNVTYTDAGRGFSVVVKYSVQGSQFGCCSDLAEQITITNTGRDNLEFTFFEYTDFDIGDIFDGEASFENGNTFLQSDQNFLTETIVGPSPDRWEIDYYSATLQKLLDGDIDDLSNSTSPLLGGDLTWAAQWNFVLAPDRSVTISKDKLVTAVPLPAPALLLMGGLAMLGAVRQRRSRPAA